jgi:hypothetical protein
MSEEIVEIEDSLVEEEIVEEPEPELDPIPDDVYVLTQGDIDTPKWRLSPVGKDILVDVEDPDWGLVMSRLAALRSPGRDVYTHERVGLFETHMGEGEEVEDGVRY